MLVNSHRSRTGFTLIELLVVIAIISILSAILFPVFARARENARRVSCLSNLKQIGLGVMQYAQDYDERYPLAWWGAPGGGWPLPPGMRVVSFNANVPSYLTNAPRIFWMDLIFPYTKSVQLYNCPSARLSNDGSYGYSLAISNFHHSAGAGAYSAAFGGNTSGPYPISVAQVQRPSEIFMIGDFNSSWHLLYGPTNFQQWGGSTNTAERNRVSPHLEGTSIVFADGHAKWRNTRGVLNAMAASPACGIASGVYCSREWNPFLP